MHNDMYKRTDNNFHSRPVTLTATKQNQRAMKAIEQDFNFEYGATREQACIMCHLSAECGGCCVRCMAEGRNGTCHGQICSLPGRDHMGQRFETWMYIVREFRPDLKRYLPRKYWKLIERKR